MMMTMMNPARKDDEDDLGLSLSLSRSSASEIPPKTTTSNNNDDTTTTGMNRFFQMSSPPPHQLPLQLNLMMMPSSSPSPSSSPAPVSNCSLSRNPFAVSLQKSSSNTPVWSHHHHNNSSTANLFHQYTTTDRASAYSPGLAAATASTTSTFAGSGDPRSFLKGIDVNRLPSSNNAAADEDEVGVSSPNSTLSSVSGKRCEREAATINNNNNNNNFTAGSGDDERACSRGGGSDDEDGDASRKKLRLSKDQSAVLEESFKDHNTLNPKQKLALAKRLGLRPRQVEVWFQNRRARTKLKQTEVDCEFLKRCCEQLTEENRRLQKEVSELRALKLSPQFYMQMTPPTTLTMCPSCERVGAPGAGGISSTAPPPPPSASNNNISSTEAPSSPAKQLQHRSGRPAVAAAAAAAAAMNNPWGLAAPAPINSRPYEALQPRS